MIEFLGVEVEGEVQHYPERKVEPLAQRALDLVSMGQVGMIRREEVATVVGKEKWAAHLALDINPHLASGYAIANAPGRSAWLASNETFAMDQNTIAEILRSRPTLPLVPSSTFPPLGDVRSVLIFQDASTSWGAAGWLLVRGVMHAVRVEWPEWVKALIKERKWSISPGEAWIMHVLLTMALAEAQKEGMVEAFYSTFTDNESARSAHNKVKARPIAMTTIARAMAECRKAGGMRTRALRVATHENKSADAASRQDGERAAQQLADALNVPLVTHDIPVASPLWKLIVPSISGM